MRHLGSALLLGVLLAMILVLVSWGRPLSRGGAARQQPLQSYPQSVGFDRRPARALTVGLWFLPPASPFVVRHLSNARSRLARYASVMHHGGPTQSNA